MVDVGIQVEDLTHTTHEPSPSSIKDENSENGSQHSQLHGSEGSEGVDYDDIQHLMVYRIFAGISLLVSAPVYIAIAPIMLALPRITFNRALRLEPKIKGIYEKVFFFEPLDKKIQRLSQVNIARMGCLGLLWLVINLSVPSLKRAMLLGSPLWKWSLFITAIFYLYACVLCVFSSAFAAITLFSDPKYKKDKAYFLVGLGANVSWLLYVASILIVWLAYFQTGHGLKQNSQSLDMYVTWTLVSFLVGAILGVVKASVVLQWKVDAIYRRFKPRILMAGFELFFLCIIVNRFARISLMPWRYQMRPVSIFNMKIDYNIVEDGLELNDTTDDNRRRSLHEHFISARISLLKLSWVADLVASLAEVMRDDDGISQVKKTCEENIPSDVNEMHITSDGIVELFKSNFLSPGNSALGDDLSEKNIKDSARLLLMEVHAQQQTSDEPITCEVLRKWMVDAHKDCLALGYTLVDAFAVVNVLERLLSWSIVAIVILFWLIVTGLATTKVLVTIVSPFLALTFMFGDTFKLFFQGVIFSFATHPFDVGDECLIDNDELVVKNINILTTSFYGNNKKDVVLLPNSDLATKRITVHKVVRGRRDEGVQTDG